MLMNIWFVALYCVCIYFYINNFWTKAHKCNYFHSQCTTSTNISKPCKERWKGHAICSGGGNSGAILRLSVSRGKRRALGFLCRKVEMAGKRIGVGTWVLEWKEVVIHLGELKPPLSITQKVLATPEKQLLSTQLTKERSVFLAFFFFCSEERCISLIQEHIYRTLPEMWWSKKMCLTYQYARDNQCSSSSSKSSITLLHFLCQVSAPAIFHPSVHWWVNHSMSG